MSPDRLKERIKVKTEFLKFYLLSVIGLVTGVASLFLKDHITRADKVGISVGCIALVIVVVLLIGTNRSISRLASRLN